MLLTRLAWQDGYEVIGDGSFGVAGRCCHHAAVYEFDITVPSMLWSFPFPRPTQTAFL